MKRCGIIDTGKITSVIIILVIFYAGDASAASYYVSQSSAGTGDGSSYANRASVATHNAGTGVFSDLSGDTVYLSGDFTMQINVRGGSNNNYAVYDGDDGARKARFISAEKSWNTPFNIDHKNFVELRDLRFDNFSRPAPGGVLIKLSNGCENILIHDSIFRVTERYANASSRVIDMIGPGKNIEIYNNRFSTSSVYDVIVFTLAAAPGNDLTDIFVHHNIIEGCRHGIMDFKTDIFSVDGPLNATGSIRNIKIHDNELSARDSEYCRAFNVAANSIGNPISDVYIYNNYWHDLRIGSQIKAVSNVHIYNNIIANHRSFCIEKGMSCDGPDPKCLRKATDQSAIGCYWGGGDALDIRNEYGPPGPVYIFNNTFFNNSRNALTISLGGDPEIDFDVFVNNNLIIENDFASNIDPNGGKRGNSAPVKITRYDSSTINTCFEGEICFNNNMISNTHNDEAVSVCSKTLIYTLEELNQIMVNSKRLGISNIEGDPKFRAPNDPLGPDGKMFTGDDGLMLTAGSSACTASDTGGAIGAYPCATSASLKKCNDKIDNDGDGKTDHPSDPGCSSTSDDDENDCGNTVCETWETCKTCATDCGACASTHFQPGSKIEAEGGTLISPMLKGTDSQASGGSFISSAVQNSGSAAYSFIISTPGTYIIEAGIKALTVADDSFFVGLDAEKAQGDDSYAWDTIETSSWKAVSVSRRGSGNHTSAQHDPMVWRLSAGTHTFTFHGRESGIQMDWLILKPYCIPGDTAACDGCVTVTELGSYLSRWKNNEEGLTLQFVMEAIKGWKKGC